MSFRFLLLGLCCLVIMSSAGGMKRRFKKICYPQLGCFETGEPWHSLSRPVGSPESPEKLQTKIYLYTRPKVNESVLVSLYPEILMKYAKFNSKKKSVMIVHGFDSSGDVDWIKDMKNVYLKKVDANVMIVDWRKGAATKNYLQAVTTSRIVGRQLALFVQYLIKKYKADPKRFHLIGHSLGAHICSYLAKEVPGIGRLTALDPAQPYFEGFPKEVRLDKTDAKFVDVIHTDAQPFAPNLGLGIIAPHGHVDFYINGGYDQPGCRTQRKRDVFSLSLLRKSHTFAKMAENTLGGLSNWLYCSHLRATQYFIEAINQTNGCVFWGRKALIENNFKSVSKMRSIGLGGKLMPLSYTCTNNNCIRMGLYTEKSPLRGVFVVTTNDKAPYCTIENKKIDEKGEFTSRIIDYSRQFVNIMRNLF